MWRNTIITILTIFQVQALAHAPPKIIKQPPIDEIFYQVSQWNEKANSFVLECEAEGEPAPSYHWRKNGKRFDWQAYDDRMEMQPDRGTLVITRPWDEDVGQYQCYAENDYGTAISNTVFVRKSELKSFKDEMPKSITAAELLPLKIPCERPDGWPTPKVYWVIQNTDGGIKSINNSRITVDPEGTLHFSNVTRFDASDEFYYACVATSEFRNEYKIGNRVILNVIPLESSKPIEYPPTLQYASRKNEVAIRGKNVELFCIYGGTPLPRITWNFEGKPITWSDCISSGHFGKSIIIRHVTFEDEGLYTCAAENGIGSQTEHSIKLKVFSIPFFTVEPQIQNTIEGETVEFHCEAFGVPEPEVKWIHNRKPITAAAPNPRRIVKTNSILLENVKSSDTGNYGCNATNSLGYIYKDVYLNVFSARPTIIEPPRDETVLVDQSATMHCRATGSPTPTVVWMRRGLELTGDRFETQENGDLVIESVNFYDADEYTCYVHNELGDDTATAWLNVKNPTQITTGPQDIEVTVGETAKFYCNANADSPSDLKIKWLKGIEEIDFENEPRFAQTSVEDREEINFEDEPRVVQTNENSLIISKTNELDSGIYTCVASTELNEARASARLIVQDVPNAPHLTGTMCRDHDATVSWDPRGDNSAPILYYIIQYSTAFTPDTWLIAHDKISATDLTCNVSMTIPWATYTFRVIGVNKNGESMPSEDSESCKTKPDVPYKNPDNVTSENTSPSQLVISWTHMPKNEHNGPNFKYRVSCKRDIPEAKWIDDYISYWKREKYILPGQPAYTRYRIKVSAMNELGESKVAPIEQIGYSGEDVPSLAPNNFMFLTIKNSTSADFSWDPVAPETVNGDFKGYKIFTWNNVGEEVENMQETRVNKNTTRAVVNNLPPDTIVYARVVAFNSLFDGPSSAIIDFKTPEGVPHKVRLFEGNPLGTSAFLLHWLPPLKSNGKLIGYKISYEEVSDHGTQPSVERVPQITDPRETQAKLAGLKPNTTYRVHIAGVTKAGSGDDYSIHLTTGMNSYPPDQPDFKWQQWPSENGFAVVKITWIPNIHGRAGSHFFVKYRIHGESTWLGRDYEFENDFIIIRGLQPSETYEFVVVSVDGEHWTESQIQEIRTIEIESKISDEVKKPGIIGAKNTTIGMCLKRMNKTSGKDLYVKHRLRGDTSWSNIDGYAIDHEYIVGLIPNNVYEFVVTSPDDDVFDTNVDMTMTGIGELIQKALRIQENWKNILKTFVISGDVKAIEVLLQNPVEDLKHMQEPWPLHEASSRGYVDIVKLLLAKGLDVNTKNKKGNTALHNASQSGKTEIVKILLEHKADVNAENDEGNTSLHLVNNIDIVEPLLAKGASAKAKNKKGQTAQNAAESNGNMAIALEINVKAALIHGLS